MASRFITRSVYFTRWKDEENISDRSPLTFLEMHVLHVNAHSLFRFDESLTSFFLLKSVLPHFWFVLVDPLRHPIHQPHIFEPIDISVAKTHDAFQQFLNNSYRSQGHLEKFQFVLSKSFFFL